ncbi:MAG: monovalent cation/H+ antiporter subunit D family protein [Desulfobacterales bacterium]|nr:monovalent cation/H+ antiporter subunit D family protein [Desulfobacterales bacterium]
MLQQLIIIIVVLPLMASLIITCTGSWSKKFVFPLAFTTMAICFAGACLLLQIVLNTGPIEYWLGSWPPPMGISFRVDAFGALMLVLILFLGTMTAGWAKKSVEKELPEKEVLFWALYLLLITGLAGMIATGDLFNLFVLLEVASLTSYALVAMGNRQSVVAGFRYLLIGTVGACFYLLGVGYLYLATGTLNMADLAVLLPKIYTSNTVMTAFVFILIGFSIKIALFPFHSWQPDAYTFAPSAATILISTAVAKTFAYAMVRIVFSVFTLGFLEAYLSIFQAFVWLGAVAILAGSLFAIVQNDLKRMLAYSSISNVGYIVLGVGLAVTSRMGLIPAVVQMVNHAVIKGAMFMAACGFIHVMAARQINRLNGIWHKMPFTVIILIVSSLSMIGLPPGAGFVSKWYLIQAAVEAGQYGFVAIIFISTLLMLVYFWRLIESMYIRPNGSHNPDKSNKKDVELPPAMLIPGIAMASLTFLLGLIWISGALHPLLNQINLEMGLEVIQ